MFLQFLTRSQANNLDNIERTELLIEGCSIVAKSLPYEHKNLVLAETEEMVKYLLICVPIFQTNVRQLAVCNFLAEEDLAGVFQEVQEE